ncbi:MAG TPA: type IV secretion system protein VirB10 [Steroidobacteraceae bacterium]|nr:type IV secretion system protein VirB10 [Steroidobacteraceae bacterium]
MTQHERGAQEAVEGERGVSTLKLARSTRSRVSNLLALGLVLAVGASLLGWYYTDVVARQVHAPQRAPTRPSDAAPADVPPPPLGEIHPPETRLPLATSASATPAVTLGPPERESVAPVPVAWLAGTAPGTQVPAPHPVDRRLRGVVFTRQSSAPDSTATESSNPNLGPNAEAKVSASTGATSQGGGGELGTLLHPSTIAAVAGQLLPSRRLLLGKGAFIDCTLETAIDSTLPGLTTCVTATDTFGIDGDVVLLERGTKLIGETRGQVQQGMARVFVLWNEARTPSGIVVPLASPGADELGRSGLPGQVNHHFWERFGAAMLISAIDGAVQAAAQPGGRGGATLIYSPAGAQDVLTEVLKGTVNIAPTIVKHQGDRIQVMVARDLDFRGVYELRVNALGR